MSTGLVAVFDTWKTAGQLYDKASQALAKATDELCGELTAAGAAWGHDDLGRAFFNGGDGKPGFGTSRDLVLPQIADMINVLAGTGEALVTAGITYHRSEHANTIGTRRAGRDGRNAAAGVSYRLPPYTGGMAVTDPPPGELIQIMDLVESLVAGCSWPDGSIGGLEQIRAALSTMATAIGHVIKDVSHASSKVTGSNVGDGAEEFARFAGQVVQALQQLQQASEGLAASVDILIRQKDAARIQFVAGLVFLAASFLIAQALAVWTFGASEAAFMETAVAEGQALRAFMMILAKTVIEGLWYAAGMDAIAQLSRMIEGLQHGFNVAEFAKAGAEGALAGLVMGGLGLGASFGAERSGALEAVMTAMEDKGAKGQVTRLAFSSATGFAGNVVSQAALNDGHVDWEQAGAFAVGMTIIGEGSEKLTRGRHARTPEGDPGDTGIASSDVIPAVDEIRQPLDLQAAPAATPHDPSAEEPAATAASDQAFEPRAGAAALHAPADAATADPPVIHLASSVAAAGGSRDAVVPDIGGSADALTSASHSPAADHPLLLPDVGSHSGTPVAVGHVTSEPPDTTIASVDLAREAGPTAPPARLADVTAPRTGALRPEADPAAGDPLPAAGHDSGNRIADALNQPEPSPAGVGMRDAVAAGDTSTAHAASHDAAQRAPKSDDGHAENAAAHARAPEDPSPNGVPAHHAVVPGRDPVHVEVDATHPPLPVLQKSAITWGEARDVYGKQLPGFDGEPTPDQVPQGGLGDCGMIATIRAVARRFPDVLKKVVTVNDDGSVTVRLHETRISEDGTATEATGRIIELRMEPDLPVKRADPGRPAYANVRRGKALWGGWLEKGIAGVDKTWPDARKTLNAKWFPKYADEGGYARLNRGSFAFMRAELLTQLTGERARTVSGDTVTECAETWKQLLDEGKPVIGASLSDEMRIKRGGDPNAYDLISNHVHEIVDVIEGPNGLKDGWVVLSNPWGRKDPQPIPIAEMGKYLNGTIATLDDRPQEGAS